MSRESKSALKFTILMGIVLVVVTITIAAVKTCYDEHRTVLGLSRVSAFVSCTS